jgi:Protein of unknown function (DUF2971)
MPSVFHYTNTAGLLGILSSRTLFATDYRFLNDASEGAVIRNLILPVFEKEVARILPKLAEKGLLKGFYEFHGESGRQQHAEGMYESLVKTANDMTPVFVLSFCRHENDSEMFADGLLSQWRGYGEAGGFAIEFDELELDSLLKLEGERFAYAGWRSRDVCYDKYEEVFDPKTYEGFAGESLRMMFEPIRDISEITGRANIDAIISKFVLMAPLMKHSGFREEQEYRIVVPRVRANEIPKEMKTIPKKVKFRAKKGGRDTHVAYSLSRVISRGGG